MRKLRLWLADLVVNFSLPVAFRLAGLRPVGGAVAPTAGQSPAGYAGPGGVAGVMACAQLYFDGAGGASVGSGTGVPGATSMNGGAAVAGDLFIRSDGGGAGTTHIYVCTAAPGTWIGIA